MSAVMAEPAADAAPAGRPKKKIMVIGIVVILLGVLLAGGAVVFFKQRAAHAAATASGDDEAATSESSAATTASHIDPKNVPIYLPLDPFIVNLADREADRYAQIGITFELESNATSEQIKAYMPAIRNAILLILANKTSKELMFREGKEQLAQEIMREAVRPMGIEVATPEPVTAPGEAASGAAAAASRPKARRALGGQHNPIVRVHFSSFIIQ